jgi:2-dehydro-3-deoxygluconokinase
MKTVTFGELMLRLAPVGFERLFQTPALQASFGGAEANVAVSLAHFGHESHYVTRLPGHAVGEAALAMLRSHGVRTGHIQRGGERLGIYFAETGASQRPSTVIYDRSYSSISQIEPGTIDWREVLESAAWFYWSGITPALSERAAACIREAVETAAAAGVPISVDLNYRRKLWTEQRAREIMRPLVRLADLVIANEEDLQTVLGLEVQGTDVSAGVLDLEGYRAVAHRVRRDFDVPQVAITLRESLSASDNGWQAIFLDRDGTLHQSQRYEIRLVDRIGAGDSFAAGLIHGLVTGRPAGDALHFAVAASALKHTIPGDVNRVSIEEVERLAGGDASGRVRR